MPRKPTPNDSVNFDLCRRIIIEMTAQDAGPGLEVDPGSLLGLSGSCGGIYLPST